MREAHNLLVKAHITTPPCGDNKKALDVWDENYTTLFEYKEEHGDCLVPKVLCCQPQCLVRWVTKQHLHYKASKKISITH